MLLILQHEKMKNNLVFTLTQWYVLSKNNKKFYF